MKIFVSIRECFEFAGFYQPHAFQNKPLNLKSVMIANYLSLNVILSVMFFIFEAINFEEYSESFYISVTYFTILILCTEFIRNTARIFELIMNFENAIQKREKNIFIIKY